MNIGFIGLGNMASAIIKGMTGSGAFRPEQILGYDPYAPAGEAVKKATGITVVPSVREAVAAETVVLAVKPQVLPTVLLEVAKESRTVKLFISIAAGKPISFLREYLGEEVVVARVMPNINAKVGAATSAFTAPEASEEQKKTVVDIFSSVGTVTELPEHLFSIFTAVSGSSPAFTYMYIDALAKAAVRGGVPRHQALAIAASSVFGSAKMVLEGGEHPMELVDQVSSPAGTTIEGVMALQENGFEHAVHAAVEAAAARDMKMR